MQRIQSQINRITVLAITLILLGTTLAFSAPKQAENLVAERPSETTEATVVKVGIWLVDIDSIDSAAQSFVANFFLTLKWNDKRLVHYDKSAHIFDVVDVWTPKSADRQRDRQGQNNTT